MAAEWAEKAQALLALAKLNIADAMAWQRDAAKAGAPLSREPLAGLKVQLAERVKGIEDLQHRVQVQREAAVLLAQRIEMLSTKSWRDAQAAPPNRCATTCPPGRPRPTLCRPTSTGRAWTPSSRRCWTPRARSCRWCGTHSRARWAGRGRCGR
jgi:hypothetical protein